MLTAKQRLWTHAVRLLDWAVALEMKPKLDTLPPGVQYAMDVKSRASEMSHRNLRV